MEEPTETSAAAPAVDNDPQAMSPEQLREVQAAQLAQAQRLQRVQQADGTYRYEAPFNASRGQRVAAARANANRGIDSKGNYLQVGGIGSIVGDEAGGSWIILSDCV